MSSKQQREWDASNVTPNVIPPPSNVTKKNKKLQRVLSGVKFQASSASTSALTGMEVELQLMAATNSSWPVTDPGIGGQSPSKKKTRALRDRPAQCSGLCEHHTHPHVRTRASTGTHTAFLSTPTYISQAHARPYARLCAHTHTHTHTHKHTRTATCAVHSSAFSLIPPSSLPTDNSPRQTSAAARLLLKIRKLRLPSPFLMSVRLVSNFLC